MKMSETDPFDTDGESDYEAGKSNKNCSSSSLNDTDDTNFAKTNPQRQSKSTQILSPTQARV